MKASGPTIAPIVTGAAGSSTWRGMNGGTNASTSAWSGRSTSSTECVSTKPSMQTITGRESRSASTNACRCRSTASCTDAACSWIQPESRSAIESEWSFQMLMGAPMARFATVITIGKPSPEALNTASAMYSRPWLALAV